MIGDLVKSGNGRRPGSEIASVALAASDVAEQGRTVVDRGGGRGRSGRSKQAHEDGELHYVCDGDTAPGGADVHFGFRAGVEHAAGNRATLVGEIVIADALLDVIGFAGKD